MRGLGEGASALDGSDAVAGVVNTILRKDYDGAEATIRHGGADDGSMDETSAPFLGGKNFNDGRTNVMGFVGYYHRDELEDRTSVVSGTSGSVRVELGGRRIRIKKHKRRAHK